MAILEHVPDLTLAFLNEATQAWVAYSTTAACTPRSAPPRSAASSPVRR